MNIEDISNHVISHSLKHISEPCEKFESFHFIKKNLKEKHNKYVIN